jgi:hypothetical protein
MNFIYQIAEALCSLLAIIGGFVMLTTIWVNIE